MADANVPPRPVPAGWGEAFAALPLEAAPAEGWARLATALPLHPAQATPPGRPANRRGIWALAACLALALPVAWWASSSLQTPAPDRTAAARTSTAPALAPAATPSHAAASAPRHVVAASDAGVDAASRPADAAAATDRPVPTRVPATANRLPARATGAPVRGAVEATAATSPAAPASAAPEAGIDQLRLESARLEALAAYARNDRMASAAEIVLTATLDDELRLIDSVLSQPGLDAQARTSLWGQRVDALQELAALAGTQRWMAAHGASMDAVAQVH